MPRRKKSDELIIAKVEIAKRASESVIANIEKTKLAAELIIAEIKEAGLSDGAIIKNVEDAKYAAELAMVNIDKAKKAAEMVFLTKDEDSLKKEPLKHTDKPAISNVLKAKRAARLIISNGEKAKRAAKLVIDSVERAKHASESIFGEKSNAKHRTEKQRKAANLFVASLEKAKHSAQYVIENVDKAKHATELVIADHELVIKKEKAHYLAELSSLNKKLLEAYNQEKLAKEKYVELYNFAPSGYITLTRKGMIIELNHLSSLIFEKDRSFLLKSWFSNYVSTDSRPVFDNFLKQIFESKIKQTCDITLLVDSNLPKFVYLSGVISENGNECLITINDITARKQAEESLRESEERFELLFNQAPLGYQSLDIDGHIIEVNQQWLDTLGYSKNEVIGRWFGEFLSPLYQDSFREMFPIFIAEGKINCEFEMNHKNGKKLFIDFDGRIAHDKKGAFRQSHCILQDITEQRKLEKDLINSEIFLKETQVIANLGSYSLDIGTGKWVSSEIMDKIFGLDSDFEKTIESWVSIIHPDWQKIMSDYFSQEVILRKVKFDKEYKVIRQNDKAVRWVHGMGDLKFNDLDQPIEMIGTIRDITEQKLSELALRDANSFNETLIKTIPFGMDIVDETGAVLYQSENFRKVMGVSAIGKRCWELYTDDQRQCIDCPLIVGISIGETQSLESHRIIKNRVFEISHTGMLYQGKKAILEIFQDITERKRTEQKLLRSEYELKKAQQITHIGSWFMDINTKEVTWTEELYKMYGFDPNLPPPPYSEHMKLFTPESWEMLTSSLAQTSETGVPYELELKTVRKDGSNGWMWVRGEAQIDSEGKIFGLWGAAQDISERKEREDQLKIALIKAQEADRLKSAFLTNMSHEIRTPMNGILGFAELLTEPTLTVDEQQDYIRTIWISGQRMLNTINSIVDISKIEAGIVYADIKETNINNKMQFTYNFFKPEIESKGLQFLFRNGLPAIESNINTDNEKLYAILTNLVKNAIKFTRKGSIEIGYEKKGEYLEFYVKDTGIGIPDNQKGLIFERFRQGSESISRGYEGSGLGLSISKSYVEMLGGRMWVESTEGLGSTFYFTIPYNPVVNEVHGITVADFDEFKILQENKMKVLIVEDDEISYSLLARIIQKISKEIIHALTGLEAIEACRKHPDFDLILMDIRMPEMSGLEATRQIRKFNKDVVIIAQTAYGFTSDSQKALQAGCNDYIAKPINQKLLFEIIKMHYKI